MRSNGKTWKRKLFRKKEFLIFETFSMTNGYSMWFFERLRTFPLQSLIWRKKWMKNEWRMNERWMKNEWRMNEEWMKNEWKMDEKWMKNGWKMNEKWMKNEWISAEIRHKKISWSFLRLAVVGFARCRCAADEAGSRPSAGRRHQRHVATGQLLRGCPYVDMSENNFSPKKH